MKKKLVIFAGLAVILVGVGFVVMTQLTQKPEISHVLSERSKEYLAEDKDGSALGKMYLGEKEELQVGKRVNVDNCFTLVVPFALKTERRDKKCDFYMAIEKPRGSITAYLNTEPSAGWENVPGISMRRQSTWSYQEKSITANGKAFLTFKQKEKGKYQRSAFYRTPTYFVVINLEGFTGDNLDKKFEEMLGSLTVQ
jgi:hypothetical protein